MKGKFTTAEVVSLLNLRAPPEVTPQFRLQRFLLRRKDWKTYPRYNMHIGEQGEIDTLRRLLGKERLEKIEAAKEDFRRHRNASADNLFPTPGDFVEFIRYVEKSLGKSMIFEL